MQRRRLVLLAAAGCSLVVSYLATVTGGARLRFHDIRPFMSVDVSRQPHTNRLIREKSPYLLEHAHNPVDWYPWGDEAFQAARAQDRPVFLSVGYSTCYWCHVMMREVFEDTAIARLMNEKLICIKVDREERPDIDRIYMSAVQAMTGGGGWPMSVFMTPDGAPFFGATYIPPRPQYGRPGFPDIVTRIAELWATDRRKLLESGDSLLAHLRSAAETLPGAVPDAVPEDAFRRFAQDFDSLNGGFGGGPKFPRPATLNFLFRYHARTGERHALEMALATLRGMAAGGVYDQCGGGFHRYSVDGAWRVPHFEKMLYDQAQLVSSYLDAYQITHDSSYAEVARDILAYVSRDLGLRDGGFASAEDAESAPDAAHPEQKEEGAFYLWTAAEVEMVCGAGAAQLAAYRYGIAPGGNVSHDPAGAFAGRNILYAAHSVEETAAHFGIAASAARETLTRCRGQLLKARGSRPRPHLDDKVLTSWNGLMISALARAAQVLGDPGYRLQAERAAGFVLSRLAVNGSLLHRYRDGEARFAGGLEDYAFLVAGLLDLYECSFDVRWLDQALALTRRQVELFWDSEHGGFYDTPEGDGSLVIRTKESYDGAEPAGNSVAAMNLLRLGQFTGDPGWERRAGETVEALGPRMASLPEIAPQMLCAVEWMRSTPNEIVVAGDPGDPGTLGLLGEVWGRYLPHKVVIVAPDGEARRKLEELAPFLHGMHPVAGRPAAYVCVRQACQLPTSDPHILGDLLERR